jgi:putative FmdB family regulatory protein
MPIYEYKCKKCHSVFEKMQSIHSTPLTECIYCHGEVEKLISLTSFQFKGKGWYVTDYAKKDKLAANDTPSASPVKTTETTTEKTSTEIKETTTEKKSAPPAPTEVK